MLVSLSGMTKRYGELTAADGLSFEVERGEMFGLIGPDGAGKTTTLRVILGLLASDGGTVRTFGLDPYTRPDELSNKAGYLSQRFSLYGDLTVDENVAFFAAVHGVRGWRPKRDALLEMLRMSPFRRRLADRLSGGMKQKLALACTLIHTPELLVLDEPTTGVDPVSRREFWKILSELHAQGMTILLTTPYLDEAERCHRVGLMDHGRLLSVASPYALREQWLGVIVEVIASPRRRAEEMLEHAPGVTGLEAFGDRLHVSMAGLAPTEGPRAAEELARRLREGGLTVEGVRAVGASLEDVFIARISRADAEDAPAGGGKR